MKRIVFDFIARWWWMFLLFVLFTGFIAAFGMPLLYAPAALICLLFDAQRGVLRCVRPLPVTGRAQALAWWFIGVALLPLISLAPLCLGTIFYCEMRPHPAAAAPWFYTSVQFWVGSGFGGFLFLIMTAMPTHPPSGIRDWFHQIIFGSLWGFSMPAIPFILPKLPKTSDAILPWHLALFAASPICVILSFLNASTMLRRRMFAISKANTDFSPAQNKKLLSGLTGVPLFLVTFISRLIALLTLMALFQFLFFQVIIAGKNQALQQNPISWIQIAAFAMMFGAITIESIGLRAMRCLPLSTVRLSTLLLAIPCAIGLFAAALIALVGHIGYHALPPAINFAAQALALAGFSSLLLAITLHISSSARLLIYILFTAAPAFGLTFFTANSAMLAIVGACALAVSFVLLQRGLRKSSAFYRPRMMFGMAVNQRWTAR